MRKFIDIFQEKGHLSGAKVECNSRWVRPSFSLDIWRNIALGIDFLGIVKSGKQFPVYQIIIFRERIPFYAEEVIFFAEQRILERTFRFSVAPFVWIFVFALYSLADEKIKNSIWEKF